jgi:hypothetical protein
VDKGFPIPRTLASCSPFGIGDRNFAIAALSSSAAVAVNIALSMCCTPTPDYRRIEKI